MIARASNREAGIVGFRQGGVGDGNGDLLAVESRQLPPRPGVVPVVRIHRRVQRPGIRDHHPRRHGNLLGRDGVVIGAGEAGPAPTARGSQLEALRRARQVPALGQERRQGIMNDGRERSCRSPIVQIGAEGGRDIIRNRHRGAFLGAATYHQLVKPAYRRKAGGGRPREGGDRPG